MRKKEQITDITLTEPEQEISDQYKFFQIDFLKAAMIFLVIFDHIVAWSVKSYIAVTLWERISIPVFLVILGFNASKSFQRKEPATLRELYSWGYFKNKIIRYIIPFLVLYIASTLIGLFIYKFDFAAMYDGQFYPSHGIMNYFVGILPFWGPGNWFLPLLFQSILIMPLLYKAFKKSPILALILCFIIEIVMHLIVFFFIGDLYPGGVLSLKKLHILNMFMTSTLFYLSGIGLGMWFSFGHKLEHNRNFFMWIIYPISLGFIVAFQFYGFRIMIGNIPLLRGDYHLLIFPYSAFLFLLAMKFLPQRSEGRISRAISLIGKSSYHILLIQILGYGIIYAFEGTHYSIRAGFAADDIIDLFVVWIFFISFGILWYKIDRKKNLLRRILYYINLFTVFPSILFFVLWMQDFWIPIPLIIILTYAIAALITNFIIKRPLKMRIFGLWTLFLLVTFVMLILQVEVFEQNEFWIPLIPIGTFLAIAIIGTVIDYWPTKEIFS
jgi:hypothetical protein